MGLELPVLLAARLRQVMRVVACHQGYRLHGTRNQRSGDVRPERRMPAFMTRDQAAIHPYLRRIIDRGQVEDHVFAAVDDVEFTLIPADTMVSGVADSAGNGFRGEWN